MPPAQFTKVIFLPYWCPVINISGLISWTLCLPVHLLLLLASLLFYSRSLCFSLPLFLRVNPMWANPPPYPPTHPDTFLTILLQLPRPPHPSGLIRGPPTTTPTPWSPHLHPLSLPNSTDNEIPGCHCSTGCLFSSRHQQVTGAAVYIYIYSPVTHDLTPPL